MTLSRHKCDWLTEWTISNQYWLNNAKRPLICRCKLGTFSEYTTIAQSLSSFSQCVHQEYCQKWDRRSWFTAFYTFLIVITICIDKSEVILKATRFKADGLKRQCNRDQSTSTSVGLGPPESRRLNHCDRLLHLL